MTNDHRGADGSQRQSKAQGLQPTRPAPPGSPTGPTIRASDLRLLMDVVETAGVAWEAWLAADPLTPEYMVALGASLRALKADHE